MEILLTVQESDHHLYRQVGHEVEYIRILDCRRHSLRVASAALVQQLSIMAVVLVASFPRSVDFDQCIPLYIYPMQNMSLLTPTFNVEHVL